jgi:uncharacterized protein (DUF983 family)
MAVARVLWMTLRLRCPNCGRGRIASRLFKINPTCSYCGVHFEREDGESVGGMYINLGLAELFTIGGYFLADALFHPPFVPHAIFWVIFNFLFVLLFYRHARALWIGISYLTGGVYADSDDQQEYTRPPDQNELD